ncbi:ectoine/hydroxyectoine ABC transporter substrate-binding protein EhuB [Paenibacillus sp.]|uniref:ectoine/hydroxyectoine ABC transporter substrate-binding protein EhuB n=1 Tax=Paenibacillus sp. TaxID=58172 RepID=UPI002812377C|nr:ectoine/hydroxyectoine ABC transporter substrate-binding protein EhuB [Paenibacillus sp.]
MRKGKKWIGLSLCAALITVTAACSQTTGAGETSTLERAKAEGKIVIGFANENPYAYETADGTLTGEAVEVAKAVFAELGIDEVEGKLVDFGSLISGLQAQQFDAITAGMFVNPDRCAQVAFADPEYRVGEALGVKPGNPKNLHSYEDIAADKGVKVGVMVGAIEIEYLKTAGVADDQIEILNDQPAVVAALNAGTIDAVTMTGPSLQAFIDSGQATELERVADFKQPVVDGEEIWGYGATAFRLGDEAFAEAFNAELKKLKDSGRLLEIIGEFGFTEAELPGDMTAALLCGE